VIEVTETASISDMERAKAFCAGVQALGCAVALDDFGAGFGSFHYLKHLPFRYLKIDGDFIRGLPDSPNDQLVVKALVGVVRGMGRRTIAEFVADEPTLRLLGDFGVDYAQGFQVGRPRPFMPLAA
jgi:EAL domain-containing protein (putative c-di-GMP-specific phosphodiesterase class I)